MSRCTTSRVCPPGSDGTASYDSDLPVLVDDAVDELHQEVYLLAGPGSMEHIGEKAF